MQPTHRTYTEAETGKIFVYSVDPFTHNAMMIGEDGEKVTKFYATMIGSTVKIDSKIQMDLKAGQFTRRNVTHYKYSEVFPYSRFKRLGYAK